MASFISSLSLFALVFISACFTLPIVDQQLENATSSLFNVDLTTEKVVNLRLVADDESTGFPFSSSQQPSNDMFSADQTSSMVSMEMNRLNEKRMDVEMSTSTGSFMTEDASRVPRTFDEFSTMESSTFFPTTESSSHHRRGENEVSMTTFEPTTQGFEPTTQIFEHVSRSMNVNSDNETETQSTPIKRNFDDSSFTTSEPSMQSSTSEAEPSSDQHPREVSETGMTMELTTQFMPSFTSTSSAVAPQFYTSESSTFTSTQPFTSQSSSTKKYTGLLNDESEHGINEDEHEKPKRPSQESEFFKSSSTKFQSKVETEEDSKYAHIPTAVFDQDILKKIANVPSDFMFLDEKSDVITVAPSKSLFTTMENHLSQEKLNQGKDKTHVEEEESNH